MKASSLLLILSVITIISLGALNLHIQSASKIPNSEGFSHLSLFKSDSNVKVTCDVMRIIIEDVVVLETTNIREKSLIVASVHDYLDNHGYTEEIHIENNIKIRKITLKNEQDLRTLLASVEIPEYSHPK